MAKVLKGLKVIRNHWKKSTFAVALVGYGVHKALERNEINEMMRAYCEEARAFGEKPIPATMQPYHITVILNPAANNRRSISLYQKYCAPLLHLAGLKVSVMQTEFQGQARNIMEVMANTDAVLIAGGNGTLHEAVTGLLRREDAPHLASSLPLGVLPVGKTNSVAKSLFWKPGYSQARFLAEATMAAVRQTLGSLDVIKVQGDTEKPVYAVSCLELGAFRDTDSKLPKYWYLGPLKQRLGYLIASLMNWPPEYRLDMASLPPCAGCELKPAPPPAPHNGWWSWLYSPRTTQQPVLPHTDNCGEWNSEVSLETDAVSHLRISPSLNKDCLHALIYPGDISRSQFLSEGWRRPAPPTQPVAPIKELRARELKVSPQSSDLWLNIDSEAYEARPIHLTHLPGWLRFYQPPNKVTPS